MKRYAKKIRLTSYGYPSQRRYAQRGQPWDDVWVRYKIGSFRDGRRRGRYVFLGPTLSSTANIDNEIASYEWLITDLEERLAGRRTDPPETAENLALQEKRRHPDGSLSTFDAYLQRRRNRTPEQLQQELDEARQDLLDATAMRARVESEGIVIEEDAQEPNMPTVFVQGTVTRASAEAGIRYLLAQRGVNNVRFWWKESTLLCLPLGW